jgi:hypothetical protein
MAMLLLDVSGAKIGRLGGSVELNFVKLLGSLGVVACNFCLTEFILFDSISFSSSFVTRFFHSSSPLFFKAANLYIDANT